jgi:ATP synthase delta (OSCP) subunit
MSRLAALLMGPEGVVREDWAAEALAVLPRSELKKLRAELRRRIARGQVTVRVAGDALSAEDAVRRRYPGRVVELGQDESLGAGLRVRAGDDIIDASVRGSIRDIIKKLGEI